MGHKACVILNVTSQCQARNKKMRDDFRTAEKLQEFFLATEYCKLPRVTVSVKN